MVETESNQGEAHWLGIIQDLMEKLDPGEVERAVQDMRAYMEGEMSWAELQGLPRQMLFEITERAYLKFKSNRLQEAEVLFRGLVMIDHDAAYYHTALGAIYQKQQRYMDALTEYTIAIEMDPEDLTAYVNRGEIFYRLGMQVQPLEDFEFAIQKDPQGKDPWANRARFLKQKILEEIEEFGPRGEEKYGEEKY